MSKSARFLTLALTLFIALAAVSCAGSTDDPKVTQPLSSDTSSETDNGIGPDGYIKDSLPDNLNFNTEISVLHWTETRRVEFDALEEYGDVSNDSVYRRNLNIEERLGVKLVWHGQPGNNDNKAAFIKVVQKSYNAGDKAYDVIATYSRTAGMMAVDGFLANINTIEDNYLDFSKPWWPDNIIETVTIGDAVYFITGDAATSVLHYMTAIFYNKALFDDYNIPYPSNDVKNDTWTLDRLITISTGHYQDLDSNGRQSDDDFYGFTTIYYNADGFYTGSNLRLIDHDNDNLLKISEDFTSEKAINLVDKLGPWLTSDTCYISRSGAAVDYYVPFANGNALMCLLRAFMVDSEGPASLTNATWDYGIVPFPKYDENQENYLTIVGNPFTMFGIMNDIGDERMTICSAVLECWGSEAYRLTTPAVFEICMKLKYSATEVEAEMYDVVRNSVDFDLGRIFAGDLSNMSEMPSKAMTTNASWASQSKQYVKSLNALLKKITDSFIKQQQ